jgi:acetyl-CoA C-acetyltransferase
MSSIVILSSTRTPLGAFQGSLMTVSAVRLGAIAIKGLLSSVQLPPGGITDVLMGNVLQAGQGQAPARQAAILAGLSESVRTVTINKVCGSGLQALMQASHALQSNMGLFHVVGGMENMSQAPYLLPNAREGYRLGHQQVVDSVLLDGLWDPYNNRHMGSCAEQCALKFGFSREQQDAFAVESFKRANAAQADGRLAQEITPVENINARGSLTRIELDESPGRVNYGKIPTLRPSFQEGGTITAANASSLNDGAAALLVSSEEAARENGLDPIARVVSFGVHANDPIWFTTAPIQATRQALKTAGWSVADVDLWEINEAFAVVPLAYMSELGVSHECVNVRGGAIALGHPLGCSGARIVVTLISALRERGLKRGVAALCIGGGEGIAACIELI